MYCRLRTMRSTIASFQNREAVKTGVSTNMVNFIFSSTSVWKSERPDPFHMAVGVTGQGLYALSLPFSVSVATR